MLIHFLICEMGWGERQVGEGGRWGLQDGEHMYIHG